MQENSNLLVQAYLCLAMEIFGVYLWQGLARYVWKTEGDTLNVLNNLGFI